MDKDNSSDFIFGQKISHQILYLDKDKASYFIFEQRYAIRFYIWIKGKSSDLSEPVHVQETLILITFLSIEWSGKSAQMGRIVRAFAAQINELCMQMKTRNTI